MTARDVADILARNDVPYEMVEETSDDEALFSIEVKGELWDVTVKRVQI